MNGILTIDRTNITNQSSNVDTIKSKVYLDTTSKGRHHDVVDIDIGDVFNIEKLKYATESDSNPEIASTTFDGNIFLMENSSTDTELYLMNSQLNIDSPSNKTETKLNERYIRLGRKVGDTTSDSVLVTFGLNLENNPSINSNSWITFFHLYPHAIE